MRRACAVGYRVLGAEEHIRQTMYSCFPKLRHFLAANGSNADMSRTRRAGLYNERHQLTWRNGVTDTQPAKERP